MGAGVFVDVGTKIVFIGEIAIARCWKRRRISGRKSMRVEQPNLLNLRRSPDSLFEKFMEISLVPLKK